MGGGSFALPLLRTEPALRAAPVFRMAYSVPTAHCAVGTETLMLQVRSAHPPMPHRNAFSKHPGVPVGLFSDSAPTHLRCAGVPLGLFGKPKRSNFSRVRGLHQATPCSFLQNARPPAASRPPVGGGPAAPLHPLLPPPRCRVLLLHKRWFFAGGRTERQRGWLPAQFLSLEEKRSHSRRGRRRRPLFPPGSCPARGRNHGGTLCTTKPVRTELVFRTHRLYSSGE